jgi:uncharacterized protein
LRSALAQAAWPKHDRAVAFRISAVSLVGWFLLALALGLAGTYKAAPDRIPTIQYGIFIPFLVGVKLQAMDTILYSLRVAVNLATELKTTGAEITVIPADLSRPGAVAGLMKTVEQRGLAIDTLINNAGLGDTGRFDQENPERILSMLQVNIVALTELTRLVLPQMVARKRGKVMLFASLAAFQPGPGMAVYYATKSYVLSFGRAIGHELRGTGVMITTLCPGATTSEFAQVANMQGSALFEGPVPVMTAAEVARQGYAALKAGRPQIITGPVNRIIAMSTHFTPTAILLMIAGHLNRRRCGVANLVSPSPPKPHSGSIASGVCPQQATAVQILSQFV